MDEPVLLLLKRILALRERPREMSPTVRELFAVMPDIGGLVPSPACVHGKTNEVWNSEW